MVEKTYSAQTCSFCEGTGTAFEATCVACGGKGSVMVKNPAKKCPYCRGIGYILMPNPCMSCKGTGWAGAKVSKTIT